MIHILAALLVGVLLCTAGSQSQASVSRPHQHDSPADAARRTPYVHRPVQLADADILPVAASQELSILYFLGIARGHLLASMELAKSGDLDQSVLHSRHALDEAWSELAQLLSTNDSQALRPKLEAVNESIALKSPTGEIIAAHEEAKSFIDKLTVTTYATGHARTRQTLDLVLLMLKQALAEYEEAWDNLQLKDRMEYQDGFGFVAVANNELQGILPQLRAINSQAAAEIDKTVERLTRAWPSPQPPERAIMTKPVLRALVTAVEINARQFPR
ncbi:MAG TPA: hypothetical protein VET25_12545 [Aestuariivirgaceae bacterium]|nr:hypothetical protein [Aestuariivirgaceae bacterium]